MNRRALSKAVSDNDSPVPGYLYNEIASMLLSQYLFLFFFKCDAHTNLPTSTHRNDDAKSEDRGKNRDLSKESIER